MKKNQLRFVVFVILAIVITSTDDRCVQVMALCLLGGVLAFEFSVRRSTRFGMHLLNANGGINEMLLLECVVAETPSLFLVDTGYAGPPVLSLSYLAVDDLTHASLAERVDDVFRQLQGGVSDEARQTALAELIASRKCLTYTSGCTMRLMGIGTVEEQQADMLLCGMLEMRTVDGTLGAPKRDATEVMGDVFVTHDLPNSVHILTVDFLRHAGPTLLDLEAGQVLFNLNFDQEAHYSARMHMFPPDMHGGAFVVPVTLGGVALRCTVDTGSPGPLSIDAQSFAKVTRCTDMKRVTKQFGVNNEEICSQLASATVEFAGLRAEVPVLVNDLNSDPDIDGYMGLGVLRAFNILISDRGIGFLPNANAMHTIDHYTRHTTEGQCPKITLTCSA